MIRTQFSSLLLSFCAIPALLYSQNLNATAELNLGIAAYDNARYRDAIDHLERAVTLDPKSLTGRLYLARTCDNMYVENPECDGPCAENDRIGVRAIEEFNKVLELDPSNTEALKALAWRYYRAAKSDEADRYYRKTLEVDPNDFEALYTLAVIQWQRAYQLREQKRVQLKIGRNKPLINSASCADIRGENLARVEESMTLLKKATQLFKSSDAEAYLSLLYRERADIQCGDQPAYHQDISTSVEWTHRACETRRNPEAIAIDCIGTSSRCPPPAPPPGEPGACSD